MIHFVALLALLPISFALFFVIVVFCLVTITTFGFGISRLATSIGIGSCLALPFVSLVFLVARTWGLLCFGSGLEILCWLLCCWKMTKKHIFLKNGLIIGEKDKWYDELMHILWKNLPYISNIQVDLGDLSCTHKFQNKTVCCGTFPLNVRQTFYCVVSDKASWADQDECVRLDH